jgi:PIN domain nuclease of toxin-antitoxin system
MRALLDTHAFLWWVTDDSQLSPTAKSIITDSSNLLFLSAASAAPRSFKHSKVKSQKY